MKNKIGIILGSGLHAFSNELTGKKILIEDTSTFHHIKVYSGKISNVEVILFSGRRHYYEGFNEKKLLENVDIAHQNGVNLLILTNAAGGINKNFNVSDLMLMTSHINFLNVKIPSNADLLYDKKIIQKMRSIALFEKVNLKYGSYCCLPGPAYETRSEIKFLSNSGVDAVGMSTVPEMLYASSLGIRTIGISCITNLVSENSDVITSHDQVKLAGEKAYSDFSKLLKAIIAEADNI